MDVDGTTAVEYPSLVDEQPRLTGQARREYSAPLPIIVLGSAPLQINVDPAMLSADVDVALPEQRQECLLHRGGPGIHFSTRAKLAETSNVRADGG